MTGLILHCCAPFLAAQSCRTLGHPTHCSPPGPSAHGDSPGQNTGVGCHALPWGIFPTQGSNPGLPHGRRILYRSSQQESPWILEWIAYPILSAIFPTQESNQGVLHCRRTLPAELPLLLMNFCFFFFQINEYWYFPGGPVVKNLPSNAGRWVQSLVKELRAHMLWGN